MEHYDILIVGAGAAGISAARAAKGRVLLVDSRDAPGGILLQCAHRGFGDHLTGPQYARLLLQDLPENITFLGNTTVLSIRPDKTARLCGGRTIGFDQLILATGCYEIPLGSLPIAGTRPRGIYTAGQMQELVNLRGFLPEGPVVILGSGDLGLIMAAHLAQAGLAVTLVEQRDICGGMARNQHCLNIYPIRLICGTTIRQVLGYPHLEGVTLTDGTRLPCRTLLIAAGLRPERTLIQDLGDPPWLTLCGNCRRVHPMVEAVVKEGTQAGLAAWEKIGGGL